MRRRVAVWLAWSLLALTLLFGSLGCLLFFLNDRSPDEDVWFTLAFLAFPLVGVVVAARCPENAIGWMFCIIGVATSLYFFIGEYATYSQMTRPGALPGGWFAWSQDLTAFVGWALMYSSIMLFPAGRLPSPRWRLLAWTLALAFLLFTPFFVLVVLAAPAVVLVRFWRARGEERQQIKWFAYAAGFWIGVAGLLTLNDHVLRDPVIALATNVLLGVAVVSIPVAVGIAILRYRLYDIDLLINRTLVYASLTTILVLLYFGGVTATQTLFRALTGQQQQPQLAVVASTLAIAALFNPLRHHVQSFMDRRFYRRKYDAAKTLEAFSAKLRDETDLDTLTDDLIGVVRETMQPAHVSFWLRPGTDSRDRQPH